jgi:hypothetical protein
MSKQCAFAATAAAHDDEDIAVIDHKVEVAHQHKTAVGHGEVAYGDVSLMISVCGWDSHLFKISQNSKSEARNPKQTKTSNPKS